MGTEHDEINTAGQVILNGRVTFDRRKGSLTVFLKEKKKTVGRFSNLACKPRLWLVHGCVPYISEKNPRQGSRNCTI